MVSHRALRWFSTFNKDIVDTLWQLLKVSYLSFQVEQTHLQCSEYLPIISNLGLKRGVPHGRHITRGSLALDYLMFSQP